MTFTNLRSGLHSVLQIAALFLCSRLSAQTTHLYTAPVAQAAGGISARVDQPLTHALALNRDRLRCFRAQLSEGGKSIRFTGLPTGKYDLVLVTMSGRVFEGVELGADADKLTGVSLKNFEKRVAAADTFFNRVRIHRFGLFEDGEKALLFVERIRDKLIFQQSGDQLKSNLRRLEIIDFERAADDWTEVTTRHIYREEAPLGDGMAFLGSQFVAGLGGVRVIDTLKELGNLPLPK
ncbi:MAG: hypothetical protein JWL59_3756 [Chthoniobacteraceae bacterium]|nr:hypothetical protein [Chthoniobacteraceae bacterium]